MLEVQQAGSKKGSGIAIDFVNGFSVEHDGHKATIKGAVETVEVSLTHAELIDLAAVQKELVAAPGVGKYLQFLGATLKLNAGSEVMTESGDNLAIKYSSALGVQVSQTIEMTGFIDQAADTYTNAIPKIDAIVAASAAEDAALVLDNLLLDFAGNSSLDATLVLAVDYMTREI